ncbi:MAG: hypothetical protein Unbinned4585contig1001_18 [Prokaryotic dsDNA virus sp.]|nr:MAG: hypothetical protein Unbinned4585contig1001_18 [Prokaryotic dsDNA virus sp.]|tara:strand:+ start:714 stop:1067 length:354 start_codon:yes stop_codon:yes gene_type:complete
MANKNRYTEEQIKDSLIKAGGFVSIACKSLKCTRKTIYNYIDKYPQLKDVVKDIREQYLDVAEAALIKNVKDGKTTDIIFYLKTQGKKRGYVEKSELDITSGDEPIKININIDGTQY